MSNNRIFERSKVRVRFKNEDMDFLFQWALGYGIYGGLSHGELFAIAAHIEDGKPDSWAQQFHAAGDQFCVQADRLSADHKEYSAGQAYLKAFCAYRSAWQLTSAAEPAFRATLETFKTCFQSAMKHLGLPCTAVQIPFGESTLPGYFLTADGEQPRPTLIVIGGGDTSCEDLYFFAGAAARQRGYHALLVDLPGQGDTPFNGLTFGMPPEDAVESIVDYATACPDVDMNRLAMIGFSGGGFFATRAAAYEKRIKALIADAIMFDVGAVLDAELPAILRQTPATVGHLLFKAAGSLDAMMRVGMEKYCWQGGVKTPQEFMDVARQGQVDVGLIDCPVLCLAGEGDPVEALHQHHAAIEQLRSPRKAQRIFTIEEGADAHCQINNFPLLHQVVFDWLEDIFTR